MSSILQLGPFTVYGTPITGLSVAVGATIEWTFLVEDPLTRAPIDLTVSGTAVQFSWSALDIKGNPVYPALFSHQATIPGSPVNKATVLQTSGDTVPSGIPFSPGQYAIDVWTTDVDGNRLQSLATCIVTLTPSATLPGAPVTPAPPEQPLGLGPNAGHSDTFADFPDPTTKAWLLWVADDSGYLYYSNGTAWIVAGGGGGGGLPSFVADGDAVFQMGTGGGATAIFRPITQDDIHPGFSLGASFTNAGVVEVGASAASTAATLAPSSTPTSAFITDGTQTVNLSTPFTSGTMNGPYTSSTPNAVQTFTASATLGGITRTVSAQRVYRARSWWGIATPATLNAAFIAALPSNGLGAGFAGTYAYGAGGNTKKAYFAWPSSYGSPSMFRDPATGFAFSASMVATGIAVTNGNGVTLNYDIWASDNFLNSAGSAVAS